MRVAGAGRLAMVAAVLVLLGSGCTPDPGPQPTPSPVAPTPTENAQEREQRLAYEAAEKSYRTYRTELMRVLQRGGATSPNELMRTTAGGPYLKETQEISQAYHGLGYRSQGAEKIVYVRYNGYSSDSLNLATCEDSTMVKTVGRSKNLVGVGDIRELELQAKLVDSKWKIWAGSGKKVDRCD